MGVLKRIIQFQNALVPQSFINNDKKNFVGGLVSFMWLPVGSDGEGRRSPHISLSQDGNCITESILYFMLQKVRTLITMQCDFH